MANNELHTDLRTAVRELCARFPDTYWRELNAREAYPEEFVKTLTETGYLAALIPIVWRRHCAEGKCIERVGSVDMQVTEVCLSTGGPLRIAVDCSRQQWQFDVIEASRTTIGRRRCSRFLFIMGNALVSPGPGVADNGNLRVGIQILIRVNQVSGGKRDRSCRGGRVEA